MSIFAGANSILGKPERGLSLEGWWQAFSLADKQAGVEPLQGQIKEVILILIIVGSRGCKRPCVLLCLAAIADASKEARPSPSSAPYAAMSARSSPFSQPIPWTN
jgi:hypothetical protein